MANPAITFNRKTKTEMKVWKNHNTLDLFKIRSHFAFPDNQRIATNNAASTQPPKELVNMYNYLAKDYENVHRG